MPYLLRIVSFRVELFILIGLISACRLGETSASSDLTRRSSFSSLVFITASCSGVANNLWPEVDLC